MLEPVRYETKLRMIRWLHGFTVKKRKKEEKAVIIRASQLHDVWDMLKRIRALAFANWVKSCMIMKMLLDSHIQAIQRDGVNEDMNISGQF